MKVSDEILQRSFDRVGFTRDALHAALRVMCPGELKGYNAVDTYAMRREWSTDNPTRFCCYFVSEMTYWFCAPVGSQAMALAVPNDATLHRFVIWPDKMIVDVTCDQFDDYTQLDYTHAKPRMFLQTGGHGPSKRAQKLAALLGLSRFGR